MTMMNFIEPLFEKSYAHTYAILQKMCDNINIGHPIDGIHVPVLCTKINDIDFYWFAGTTKSRILPPVWCVDWPDDWKRDPYNVRQTPGNKGKSNQGGCQRPTRDHDAQEICWQAVRHVQVEIYLTFIT